MIMRYEASRSQPSYTNGNNNNNLSNDETQPPASAAATAPIQKRPAADFSMVLLIRRLRPIVSTLGGLAYVLYRTFPMSSQQHNNDNDDHNSSLLTHLVDLISTLRIGVQDHWLLFWSATVPLPMAQVLSQSASILWTTLEDAVAILAVLALFRVFYILYHYTYADWHDWVVTSLFDLAQQHVPFVQDELHRQACDMESKGATLLRKRPDRVLVQTMPQQGRSSHDILCELQGNAGQENKRWASGKVSGTVYQGDAAHTQLMNDVYACYSYSNPLHPGFWPKLNQCEGEVIAMTGDVLHAPQPAIGCVSSGGTESILLAIRAHLNVYGKARGIRYPELVCGSTAHAAVDKACDIYGIRKVVIDCNDGDYRLDPAKVRRHITSNTILIYASAPCYPQGVVDPIPELSALAQEYDVGLHVDACLGGFVLPFLDEHDADLLPTFDFRNPGVTSMSADTHKYGYAAKGTSVVLYKTKELRHGQYFCYAKWTGGMYATPTFAGSRPGALSACAWASLVSIGHDGYKARAKSIVRAARAIAKGIQETLSPDLHLLTQPQPYMVVCFGSHELDIYRVQDMMSEMGWALNSLQAPASIHLCVTLNVVPKVDDFLKDLQVAVARVHKEGSSGRKKGTAGIYGTVGAVPAGAVEPTLRAFTDMTLTP